MFVFFAMMMMGCPGKNGNSKDYPGLLQFCDGHVTGAPQKGKPGPHITWIASYSTDSPDQVMAHYRDRLGGPTGRGGDGGATFDLSAEDGFDKLGVSPASSPGPWSDCEIPKDAKTIVMVSSMVSTK